MRVAGRRGTKGIFGPLGEHGVSSFFEPKARRNPTSPERSKGMIMTFLVTSGEY